MRHTGGAKASIFGVKHSSPLQNALDSMMQKAALLFLLPLYLQLGACSTVPPILSDVTTTVDKAFGDATPGMSYDQAAAECNKNAAGLDAREKFTICMRAKGWMPR